MFISYFTRKEMIINSPAMLELLNLINLSFSQPLVEACRTLNCSSLAFTTNSTNLSKLLCRWYRPSACFSCLPIGTLWIRWPLPTTACSPCGIPNTATNCSPTCSFYEASVWWATFSRPVGGFLMPSTSLRRPLRWAIEYWYMLRLNCSGSAKTTSSTSKIFW